jgi:CBS domain-containing protein
MKVKEVMTKSPAFCTPEDGLQSAAKAMCDSDCGELPVLDSRQSMKPVGVITDRDITCRTVARGKNPFELQVSDIMSAPAVTVTPETDVEVCCELLQVRKIRRVPVVDERGRLCGIVSQADIALKIGAAKAGELVREVSQAAV